MAMESVRFHRLAAEEYRSARDWYRQRDISVAGRFCAAVDSAVVRIIEDADSHPVLIDEIRWVRVRKFPYILVFVSDRSDSLLIIALAHAKRRPGYWKRRR